MTNPGQIASEQEQTPTTQGSLRADGFVVPLGPQKGETSTVPTGSLADELQRLELEQKKFELEKERYTFEQQKQLSELQIKEQRLALEAKEYELHRAQKYSDSERQEQQRDRESNRTRTNLAFYFKMITSFLLIGSGFYLTVQKDHLGSYLLGAGVGGAGIDGATALLAGKGKEAKEEGTAIDQGNAAKP